MSVREKRLDLNLQRNDLASVLLRSIEFTALNGSFRVAVAKVCFKLIAAVDLPSLDVNFAPKAVSNEFEFCEVQKMLAFNFSTCFLIN